jgi:pimeloyl-ACP methyl ester carboxylesterase
MQEPAFQMTHTNGVTLRTVVEGSGPLLISLRGWPQCWYLWRNQIKPLAEAGYTVAVPDQRASWQMFADLQKRGRKIVGGG